MSVQNFIKILQEINDKVDELDDSDDIDILEELRRNRGEDEQENEICLD